MRQQTIPIICFLFALSLSAMAERKKARRVNGYPPELNGAKVEVYKRVGDVRLNLYGFYPDAHKETDKRAAVVFFFGGGWRSGSPAQFQKQAEYFATRGMVAFSADYRVSSRHSVTAKDCVEDAKSAVRWIRSNAQRLGIDPARIVAAGGSAGGHIAACTGTVKGFEAEGEDTTVSSVPNAMALFNPACQMAPLSNDLPFPPEKMKALGARMGVDPQKLSPVHHVAPGNPPCIIFHGKADTTVPYRTAERFAEAMKKAGNRCELVGFDNMPHGFFNFGRYQGRPFDETVKRMDAFLTSLGFLEKPAVE